MHHTARCLAYLLLSFLPLSGGCNAANALSRVCVYGQLQGVLSLCHTETCMCRLVAALISCQSLNDTWIRLLATGHTKEPQCILKISEFTIKMPDRSVTGAARHT